MLRLVVPKENTRIEIERQKRLLEAQLEEARAMKRSSDILTWEFNLLYLDFLYYGLTNRFPPRPQAVSCCINPSQAHRSARRTLYSCDGSDSDSESDSEVPQCKGPWCPSRRKDLPCPGCQEPRVPPLPNEYFSYCKEHLEYFKECHAHHHKAPCKPAAPAKKNRKYRKRR